MTMQPEQVEAHAAQGYSLPDVARLLGVPFFSDKSQASVDAIEAFNRGAARWRDAGQSTPPRVTEIIAQAVHSQLLSKEMTRPALKEALGFRYDDLNLAIETLEKQFLIEHEENTVGTCYYRASGTPSLVNQKHQTSPEVGLPQNGNNGGSELKKVSGDPCVDCGGPKSLGSGQRCKTCYEAKTAKNQPEKTSARPDARTGKFGVSVSGEVRKLVEAMSVGAETDTPRLFNDLLVLHPHLKHTDHVGLRTYIAQAVLPLKNKLLNLVRKGRGGEPDLLCRIDPALAVTPTIEVSNLQKEDFRRGATYKELDLQEVEELMATEETMADAAKKLGMTTAQLSVRRQRDDAVADAVDRGRTRFYGKLRDEEPDEKTPQCAVCKDNTPIFEGSCVDCLTTDQQIRMGKLVSGESAKTRNIIPENIQVSESANKISTQAPMLAQRTVSAEVYGGVRMHQEVQVRVEEMANWPKERITEFFDALAKVIEIPQRSMPKTVKRAWSKEFEDDQSDEGVTGMTMLYLVSMLHDGMEDYEKEAVWTLIKYMKRMQAAIET